MRYSESLMRNHLRQGSLSADIVMAAFDHDVVTVAAIAAAKGVKAPTYEYMAVPQTFLRLKRRGIIYAHAVIAGKTIYKLTALGRSMATVISLKAELRSAETDVHTGGPLAATKE